VLADEIARRIHDIGIATDGVDLWIGEAMEEPDDGVVIRPYSVDLPAVRTMGPSGARPAADRERVQVVSRAADRRMAWERARAVRDALDWWDGVLMGTVYLNVVSVGTLAELEPDGNLRYRVAGNYEAVKERS
jgi:hypothetical protein